VLRFLRGMPADRGRIKQDLRAAERREPGGFRIPLVPADQRRYATKRRVEIAETEIAGREIEFLVIQRIVGDVHLAIQSENVARRADNSRCVVIDAGGAALE